VEQGLGSTIHCVAGDATGIVLAASVTAVLGLPMWIDLIVEYVAGFMFGLFVFQSLFMKSMMGGTYIHVREGDRVRIIVKNELAEVTTIHWHELILPNEMDGPAEVTQPPIPPGGTFTYEFTAERHGTYFYHPHAKSDRTQSLGLYGALIIDPANPSDEVTADHEYVIQLQEWLLREGLTYPAMPMVGAMPNYFTINGKAYPATDTIAMKVGETLTCASSEPTRARSTRCTSTAGRSRWWCATARPSVPRRASPPTRRTSVSVSATMSSGRLADPENADSLPHPAPYDEQQRRDEGRRWLDGAHRRALAGGRLARASASGDDTEEGKRNHEERRGFHDGVLDSEETRARHQAGSVPGSGAPNVGSRACSHRRNCHHRDTAGVS
jgi:hypothetical protein